MVLAMGECGLRISGHSPGQFRNLSGFNSVDSLVVYENFITDEAGIYRFGPWVTDSLPLIMDAKTTGLTSLWHHQGYGKVRVSIDEIDKVYRSFLALRLEKKPCFISQLSQDNLVDHGSEFAQRFSSVKKNGAESSHDHALKQYIERPFNSEGFRSIPFNGLNSGAPRVLIIGDSFVYGMSARPFYNSFTDILLARGYLVYGAGIPGTDPAQYAAIANKYVPMLRPDMVVVCFYPGNDLMPFPRESHPERPHEHMTNAGFFESAPLGQYLDAVEAYNYYRSLVTIPCNSENSGFWSSTAITSVVWNILYANGKVSHPTIETYELSRNVDIWDKVRFTRPHLQSIYRICFELGVPLLNAIVPDASPNQIMRKGKIHFNDAVLDSLFIGQQYHFPVGRFHHTQDFPENDYHFNNLGSKKYADFLDTLLRQHGLVPTPADRSTFED